MSSVLDSTEISRLSTSIKIINNINHSTVSNMLIVILKRLCDGDQHGLQIFQEDEKSKLKDLLSLDDSSIDLVIFTLHYIICQAAFHVMKPASLTKYLNDLSLNEQLTTMISELWSVHAKAVIDVLKKEPCSLLKLDSVESSIHYSLSSQSGGHSKVPLALLHFNVTSDSATKSTFSLEFSHQDLLHFHQTLETVQRSLDEII